MKLTDLLSEPDYINQVLLNYLKQRDLSEEDLVRTYSYAATYEDFIKIINKCENLEELIEIRYLLTSR